MKLIEYAEGIIYAIQWSDQKCDEYERILDYADPEYVHQFIDSHCWEINQFYVDAFSIPRDRPDKWVKHITEEGVKLIDRLDTLIDNTVATRKPGLFEHFKHTLEGFEGKDKPAMKSYGPDDPSMLRVYAIEIEHKCWIIFYSVIKIGRNFSDSPGLKGVVKDKAYKVIDYLETNGILTADDVKNLSQDNQ